MSCTQVSELIRSGRLSSRAATEAMFDRIDELDPHLLSFVTLMRESALAAADDLDERLARGDWLGPLHGVPLAIKDLAYTHDAPTGAGTTIHADFQPDFDATVVARLRAAGAVILGKLRLTEGAFTGHHPDLLDPGQPLGAQHLVRGLLERFGRRDRSRPLLRLVGLGHRRFDPTAVLGQWGHRTQIHLGPGLTQRHLSLGAEP